MATRPSRRQASPNVCQSHLTTRIYSRDTLQRLGLDWPFAEDICRVRIDGLELESGREDKGFRDRADFIARMTAFYARQSINFTTTTTLWPEIEALINNGDAVL